MIIKPFSNNFSVNSPLTGQPFLRNGQCCGGQGTNTSFQDVTTFREDYCNPTNQSGRRKQFEPPQPASVIHKNNCFLKLEGSLTQNTYKPPSTSGGHADESQYLHRQAGCMNKTNFHMSADKRLETHHTTNQVTLPAAWKVPS